MQVLKFIFICLEVLFLFNVLIFVHELGHFLAARWRGLKIERFAIWFGKPIWKTEINGIEYALGCIPAGGYVSLPQMASMEAIEGKTGKPGEQLPPISALDKIIVAFFGPLFSFGLAVAFAIVVWQVGRPVNERETSTVIGYVEKNSPAEKAGLRVGDKILEVDGKPVKKFAGIGGSVQWRIVRSEGETIPFKILRDGTEMTFTSTYYRATNAVWERKSLRQVLIDPAYTPIVGKVVTNSPAERAGLKAFDQVLSVNGAKLYHPAGFLDYMETNGAKPFVVLVRRADQQFEATLQPEVPTTPADGKPRVGVQWADGGKIDIARPGVTEQIAGGIDAMVGTLGALFSPKSDIKPQHLSGAVKILNIYYILFESEHGWRLALWFSVIMNVNLALLNLLPFPVLDGGHITLAIIEGVRRRPVNPKLLNAIQTSCAVVLIGYMLYVTFFDVQDLVPKRSKDKAPPEIIFAPKAAPK